MSILRLLSLICGLGGLLSGTLLACRSAVRPGPPAAPELIRFERTACMGPCPVDVLTIYADGRMLYEGRAHGPRTGTYQGRLSAPERTALQQQFEAAQFFDFAPAYASRATDLPTYYLTFATGGRSLRVKDYDGAPARLKALEAALIKLIDARRWHRHRPK